MHRKLVDKRPAVIAIMTIFALMLIIGLVIFIKHKTAKPDDSVVIVLSPHFDDAVLSMGGLLAKHEHPTVVATFISAQPEIATTTPWDTNSGFADSNTAVPARTEENQKALNILGVDVVKNFGYTDYQYRMSTSSDALLEQDMAQDIQALLASYGDKNISVYAPSIFTPEISHPDHALVHRAFVDVAENYPTNNVSFYFYEDYPYTQQFNQSSIISLEKNLENDTDRIFETVQIPLTGREVSKKQKALEEYASQVKAFDAIKTPIVSNDITYTEKRCADTACEVVYKLFRVTE